MPRAQDLWDLTTVSLETQSGSHVLEGRHPVWTVSHVTVAKMPCRLNVTEKRFP